MKAYGDHPIEHKGSLHRDECNLDVFVAVTTAQLIMGIKAYYLDLGLIQKGTNFDNFMAVDSNG